MIISISSLIQEYSGQKDVAPALHRYLNRSHFKELNNTGNVYLEKSWVFDKSMPLIEYLTIKPQNKIATLYYTYSSYKKDEATFFEFYLNEKSIVSKAFTENHHLYIPSIRFANLVMGGDEILMAHIVADGKYFDPKSLFKEGE